MAVDDTLGQAGGTRGVHDEHVIVAACRGLDLGIGGGADPLVVFENTIAGGASDLDPRGDVGLVASGGELGAYRGELLAEDQNTCAGVFQDELEFIGDESHVERHIDGTDLGGSEEGLDELHPVHEQ